MADDKKEWDPVKIIFFIILLIFLGILFTADDALFIGEILDPVEFIFSLIVGALFGGKVGFWKTIAISKPKPSQGEDVPAIESRPKKEEEETTKKDIIVNAKDVTKSPKLKRCPFCGERFKFKKIPKYCPFCEEEIVNKAA